MIATPLRKYGFQGRPSAIAPHIGGTVNVSKEESVKNEKTGQYETVVRHSTKSASDVAVALTKVTNIGNAIRMLRELQEKVCKKIVVAELGITVTR